MALLAIMNQQQCASSFTAIPVNKLPHRALVLRSPLFNFFSSHYPFFQLWVPQRHSLNTIYYESPRDQQWALFGP